MNAEPQVIEPGTAIVPMDLVQRAITNGASIDVLEKLMGLQERWDAGQKHKAFDAAMAAAKAEIPVINKSRSVNFTTNRGRTAYRYEDFADIADAVAPILAKHGLSYRFRTDSSPDLIAVTCIIAHRDGHSEQTTLSGPRDDSGNKNSMQAIGSAVTYLQRYTLKAALGLAASVDDDAQSAGGNARKPPPENEDDFARRWKLILDHATDDVELESQWDAEADLRAAISWRRKDPNVIHEAMRQRQTDLIAAEEKREADLQTRRLEAQDQ